jgi:hypothetical protein
MNVKITYRETIREGLCEALQQCESSCSKIAGKNSRDDKIAIAQMTFLFQSACTATK